MNQIRMQFPGGKNKALTLSYDDGVEQDVALIARMKARGVRGTFNLNSALFAKDGTQYPKGHVHRRMTRAQCLAAYDETVCEVAAHGAEHPFLESLPTSRAAVDILRDREALEEMFDTQVRGFAYPYGTYSDALVDTLRVAGVAYARTVHSSRTFDLPRDWLRLAATCHHNDPALMELTDAFLRKESREPRLFYLWGHAYEFEANDNWQVIEKFLDTVGGREDIWYATNIEVYDACQAYERLQFSANAGVVVNPSAQAVWLSVDGRTVMIPGGGRERL